MAEEFTCAVDEQCRSACKALPEYKDTGFCVLHYPGEEKNKEDFLKVVKSKLDRKHYDFGGTIFPDRASAFAQFEFDEDANFAGATFIGAAFTAARFDGAKFSGEANFDGAKFSGTHTSFSEAQFSGNWTDFTDFTETKFSGVQTLFTGAQFSVANTRFDGAKFSAEMTSFYEAQFSGANTRFTEAQFSGEQTSFDGAKFSGERTSFDGAKFGSAETSFREATFVKEVAFAGATFWEKVEFQGSKANLIFGSGAWARFDSSRIEKPEQLSFNTVLLHPGWFINADVRKVDFTDVNWYGMRGRQGTLDGEIDALKQRGVEAPYTLLAQACRRLSANAEENREYPLANEFHYWAMNALRKGRWHYLSWLKSFIRKNWRRVRTRFGLAATLRWFWRIVKREPLSRNTTRFGVVPTLYWAMNGYGVKAARAFWILFAIWLMFAALYFLLVKSSPFWVFSAPDIWQGVDYARQAAVYSLSALVRLNPRPQSEELNWFQTLVTIEGILGPLQIALLVLAIRRKVMR